ncbi:YaiI/YqxD family protein [Lederbergia panacisoli]|uniref:YaiI/YqxD family protein n=1 Tax=Lederbergia panacisoli TaxID=1255251 RepID=UPI00214B4E66|nr:DUF188 domain-containing protein [Lederbergia panacisoli]MCR2820423.1 DUF188 domain-containing protein [Lederbergia panacisoli]
MIYVDADACPVKSDIGLISKEFMIHVRYIASYDHIRKSVEESGEWIFVDPGKDSADLYILNKIRQGDILITQDIGLASLALAKGVYALSARGTEYEEESIQTALDFRYLAAKERERGNYGKGPKPFTIQDRQNFQKSLRRLLSKIEGV